MANPTTGYFTKVGAGIDSVKEDLPIGRQGIYNLQGVRLNTTPEQLPAGIYIIDGRKVTIRLISFVFPAMVVYCMLDSFLHTNNVRKSRIVNGNAPFYGRALTFHGKSERTCSVFSSDFQRFQRY